MTLFIDVSGMQGIGLTCYGGEEERQAALEGRPPPESAFRPRVNNVAPRGDDWNKSRTNTQTAPLTGPGKNQKPAAQQPRGPMFGRPMGSKVLP